MQRAADSNGRGGRRSKMSPAKEHKVSVKQSESVLETCSIIVSRITYVMLYIRKYNRVDVLWRILTIIKLATSQRKRTEPTVHVWTWTKTLIG